MSPKRKSKPSTKPYLGTWRIHQMEQWDANYFDIQEERQGIRRTSQAKVAAIPLQQLRPQR